MTTQTAFAIDRLAETLAAFVPPKVLGDLLNHTIAADAEPRLSDWQVKIVERFHDSLCTASPQSVTAAHTA